MIKKVNLEEKIQKIGEDNKVGTLGAKLSGGEKQRVLLARAFLKNSEIVLMDEPTSNLDNKNEKIIMDYLFNENKRKTIIINAHK